jgi:hypothetical protein
MRNLTPKVAGLSVAFSLVGGAALAVGGSISNPDFEIGSPGSSPITGWTAVESRINLGVDSIASCLTVDTSNYSALRDYNTEWLNEYGPTEDPGEAPADPTLIDDGAATLIDGATFSVDLADATGFDPPFTRASQVLELESDMNSTGGSFEDGYVVHGPAVYSDPFTATAIDDLSFSWAARDESDDYAIVGYLLDTSSCAWTEVVDSTGEASAGWESVTVAIPGAATYRFVFVSGTFDQSFGGAAGAFLYLDDFVLAPNAERAAAGGTSSGGGAELPAEPQIALDFRGRAGQPSEGAVVGVSGLSVPAGAVATVSLFAPEVKLFEEVSTGGAFDRAVALPAGLAPGSYTVVYRVVLPSGEVLALNVVVEIGDGGVITSVSENIVGSGPAGVAAANEELPSTGVRSSSLPWWAIITIFGGLMLIVYGRRAVKMAEAFDARLDENGHRTPWEILSTPIRVPGIDYSPGAMDGAGSSQSLGEAVRGLDVAFSLIIASQIARLRTHA